MRRLVAMMLCAGAALFNSCSNLVGGGDDFPNSKVTGALLNSDMTPAARTAVCLVPQSYNPINNQPFPPSYIDTTDSAGSYTFLVAASGTFNVLATQLDHGTRALIEDVYVTGKRDTVVPADTLYPTGMVKVMLSGTMDPLNGYVYVPGTTIASFIRSAQGSVVLNSVPAGTLPALVYATTSNQNSNVLRYDIEVPSGDSVTVANPGWKFSRQIYFNTTQTGAQVSGNVVDFPVLIRLTKSAFDFSEAMGNGADIRFLKGDAVPVPYEIERWDPVMGFAELWVRIDTVFGNDRTHFITMYWGNPAAGSVTGSAAVFDTGAAGGFQGVWHLAEKGNTMARDATLNHYDGTPYGMSSASAVAGAIGISREFDGASSHIRMLNTADSRLNLPEHGTYTVSAWVNTDILDWNYHMIASKGDNQYNLEIMCTNEWEFADFQDSTGWDVTTLPAMTNSWTHVVGIRSGAKQYLYVNGIYVDSTVSLIAADTARIRRDTRNNFMIGKMVDYQNYYFNGKIDEVRVSNVRRSADWIKLCYMNQRQDDRLVIAK